MEDIAIKKLANGMTVIAEPMADVASAGMVFLAPVGAANDPAGRCGTAGVLSDLVFRGAGSRNNRELNDALDNLGLHRNAQVSTLHMRLEAAMVAGQLPAALELFTDVLRRPLLAEDQFELCRMLALQGLESLEDDPRQKISLLVRERFLPDPLGRPAVGKADELKALDAGEARAHWQRCLSPDGTILAVAGKVDFEALCRMADEHFGDWQAEPAPAKTWDDACNEGTYHQGNDGAQVHIAVMIPAVHVSHPDYYKAMAAVTALSGGMGSRLFTEVREKRGLCYAVGASHEVIGPFGAIRAYVGSSPQQAQEALDVTLAEIMRLGEGISKDELDRAKVGLRAGLIMQGESSRARALRCAGDYVHLGRVRTLSEIEKAIENLTVAEVVEHVREHRPEKITVVTLGPVELNVNVMS